MLLSVLVLEKQEFVMRMTDKLPKTSTRTTTRTKNNLIGNLFVSKKKFKNVVVAASNRD